MKTITFLRALTLFLFFMASTAAYAGNIMGQVTDTTNHKPLTDATVVLDCKGVQRTFITNDNGYYYASNIPGGQYLVVVVNMGTTYKLTVSLGDNETREINFNVNGVMEISPVEVNGGVSAKPLLNTFDPDVQTIDRLEAVNQGVTRVSEIAGNMGDGVVEIGGVDYVRGARGGSLSYYIDDCLVMGSPEIPLVGLGLYHIYTGFIPPKYGDTVGGVVVMETRNYFSEQR